MDKITTDPQKALQLAAMIDDMQMQSFYVDDLLRNLPEITKSGKQPRNPRTSRALAQVLIPETTTIPHLPSSYGREYVPVHKLVEQQISRANEIKIMEAAYNLFRDPTPLNPAIAPAGPGRPNRLLRAFAHPAFGTALGALEALTYAGDTNVGEEEELARRRTQQTRKGK